MEKILIVDDDRELCELLQDYLGAEGFRTCAAHEGRAGVRMALEEDYDLVVLDVMLPGLNGFDALRRLREDSQVPVIMLTARGEEVDRIVGLELGADDYLPKPFNPRELVARIRAIARRARGGVEGARPPEKMQLGDLCLEPGMREARLHGEPVELTSVEYGLLEMLVRHAGQPVSREALSRQVLGRRLTPYDRSIDVHVSSLRRKLGGERIKTVRGVGYLYACTVGED
ncbi:MAG: two-component system response regulator MisR [Geothermobacteraceae bacterium]